MAKLGKQKFSLSGDHNSSRTTFSGTIELYLHYSTEMDFFYFDREEMKKYLPEDVMANFKEHVFGDCDTKDKAVRVIELLISSQIKEKRKLRIEIGMSSDIYKVPNPEYGKNKDHSLKNWNPQDPTIIDPALPSYLKEMLGRGGGVYGGSGLTLNFSRIMEVELNGTKRYAGCNSDWKYTRSDLSHHGANLIDWTPEAEKFLIETQSTLDSLCGIVLKFFNAGDNVENLLLKMGNNKLLGEGGK